MGNMYKVMAFWTGIFAVMFYLGDMIRSVIIIFSKHRIIYSFRVLKPFRAYVYLHLRSIFNVVFCWFHLLYDIYLRTWCWTLIKIIKKQSFHMTVFFVICLQKTRYYKYANLSKTVKNGLLSISSSIVVAAP